MLRSIETLIRLAEDNIVSEARRGNHWFISDNHNIYYYYHATCICIVPHALPIIKYDNGGWNTSSTTRAINSYREYYQDRREVSEIPHMP